MGQRTSTQRAFGYFSSGNQDPALQQQQQQHYDRVLSRPEDYGLDPNRILDNDFAAIDATYYHNVDGTVATVIAHIPKHEVNDAQHQKKLTFGDIQHLIDGRTLSLHSRALVRLDNDIFYLKMLTKLDLSRNHLTHLPDAFGSLHQLTHLCLSHNRLSLLPDTLHGLAELTEFNLSYNAPLQCSSITPYIGHLKKLRILDLSNNPALTELPIELGGLSSLAILYIQECPKLQAVPAELLRLPNLHQIKADKITADQTFYDPRHDPPSLVEVCARYAYTMHLDDNAALGWMNSNLPHPKPCTACGEPYFSSYVSRRRLEKRSDGTLMVYEYRLCSEHWQDNDNDDDDRRRYVFSTSFRSDHTTVLKFLPLPSLRPTTTTTITTHNHKSPLFHIAAK